MATSIIPRLVRGRLYCQTADALFATPAQAASAGASLRENDIWTPIAEKKRNGAGGGASTSFAECVSPSQAVNDLEEGKKL